jgi:hypothetical protein
LLAHVGTSGFGKKPTLARRFFLLIDLLPDTDSESIEVAIASTISGD